MSDLAKKSQPIFARGKYPSSVQPADFCAMLAEHRTRMGWSQARLAAKAGLRRETVARLELGRRRPAAETVFALERALGVEGLIEAWPESGSHGAGAHGPRCRERRRELGLTLDDVAAAAGVSGATLSRFEREDGVATSLLDATLVDDEVVAKIRSPALAAALGFASLDELEEYCRASVAHRSLARFRG